MRLNLRHLKREDGYGYEADHQGVEHHRLVELQVPKRNSWLYGYHFHYRMMLPNREHDREVDGEEARDSILVKSPHCGKTK